MQDLKAFASQILKTETATAHQNIEGTFPVMHQNFNLEDYKTLLQKLYGFYFKLEDLLANSEAVQTLNLNYEKRKKTELIKNDLKFFGFTEDDIREIKTMKPWFDRPTLGQTLGILYVLEGSTLGGQLITKHLKEKFNLETSDGLSFFNAYGNQTGVMWKELQGVLNKNLHSIEDIKDSIESAQETFRELGRWLKNKEAKTSLAFENPIL